jgi:hypothetical protein
VEIKVNTFRDTIYSDHALFLHIFAYKFSFDNGGLVMKNVIMELQIVVVVTYFGGNT